MNGMYIKVVEDLQPGYKVKKWRIVLLSTEGIRIMQTPGRFISIKIALHVAADLAKRLGVELTI